MVGRVVVLYSCESETGDEKDVIKTVQKCLNKSIANRTITKQETVCQIGKLPLVICSEHIDIISLSKAVRLLENNASYSTTYILPVSKNDAADTRASNDRSNSVRSKPMNKAPTTWFCKSTIGSSFTMYGLPNQVSRAE